MKLKKDIFANLASLSVAVAAGAVLVGAPVVASAEHHDKKAEDHGCGGEGSCSGSSDNKEGAEDKKAEGDEHHEGDGHDQH